MVSSFLLVTSLCLQAQGFQAPGAPVNGFLSKSTPTKAPDATPNISIEMRGDILMARKMYRDAIDTYKTGPSDSAVLANKIGIGYHQLLELNTARKWYERAVKLRPSYAEAINNIGTVYYARKSYRRAINEYKKALAILPDSASILSNLGTAYFSRKNYQLAFVTYQKALALDPDVFESRNATGILLQDRGVEERAKYHYFLARTYAKAGDVPHALIYVRKSLEEGFKQREKFKQDPEFAVLRKNPEFEQILSSEHKIL